MSVFVVDASVAAKWMLPELLSAEAVRLQSPEHQLHVPSFFEVELANILWKKVRQGLLGRPQADQFLSQLPGLPLARHTDASLFIGGPPTTRLALWPLIERRPDRSPAVPFDTLGEGAENEVRNPEQALFTQYSALVTSRCPDRGELLSWAKARYDGLP